MSKNNLPPIHTSSDYLSPSYTDVIDVRSPAEYAEDHIPGAINLPVLNNDQRVEVGTLYKENPFAAKKIGAAYVSENIAHQIRTNLASKETSFHPLIYCWRGGQRSRSMAITLNQIGWHVTLLDGGYKEYRTQVRESLLSQPERYTLRLVNGLTGTAKTEILHHLASINEQVLDLEGLAQHKGSLLGSDPLHPQPSQKLFESRITAALRGFDPNTTIWVESESNKIGNLHIPEKVWKLMKSAPQVEIIVPISARIKHIIGDYTHLINNPSILINKLEYIQHRVSGEIFSQWLELIEQNNWSQLVESLLTEHYDPSYTRSMSNNQRTTLNTQNIEHLDESTLSAVAQNLAAL